MVKNNDILCEVCKRRIPKKRIEALPNTRICIKCASAMEDVNGIHANIAIDEYDYNDIMDALSD